jgi:DNA-binding MarR family transcriptional regulator
VQSNKQIRRAGTIVFDDLAFKLTPSERIIFGIIHRFSGYKLGECRLKPNKLAEIAGVSRSTVYNATKHLVDLGMVKVIRHQKASGATFRALQVIREELPENIKMTGAEIDQIEQRVIGEPEKPLAPVIQQLFGDENVNALFDFWLAEVKQPITTRVQANRRAAANLYRKHGAEAVQRMVQLAALAQFSEFAPNVADFVDLQSKWQQLNLWSQKRAHAALMEKYEKMSIEDRVAFKQKNPELAEIISKKRKAM